MEIEINDALARTDLVYIDVRSPGEYAEASIPGAINIPLYDDREHHQLGIIYHHLGENQARRAALTMVVPKLTRLADQVDGLCAGHKKPLLYCRRGGLRSLSLYQILHLAGINAFRLKSGYKAFRQYVVERLAAYQLQSRLVVLHSLTGVGKTTILMDLENRGIPILDLEGLAGHKGSVFGAVGLTKPRSQKDFDALLLQHLDRYAGQPYMVVEGEGRRIGNVYLPPFLAEAMDRGYRILLNASIETRVKRIVDSYIPHPVPESIKTQLRDAITSLGRRVGQAKVNLLLQMLEKDDYPGVAKILCLEYYDHLYGDSRPECSNFDSVFDAADLEDATGQIVELLKGPAFTADKATPLP
jgi:tRNA 2-selenouridine synthase